MSPPPQNQCNLKFKINFSSEKENEAGREKGAEIAQIETENADLRAIEKEAKKEKEAEVARETEDEEEDRDRENGRAERRQKEKSSKNRRKLESL